MFVNVYHDSPAEHRRLLLAGVAMIVTIALLIGLSLAMYTKAFEDVVRVTVKADRAGLQLAENGDVRQHGVLVGRVAKVEQDGEQASIELALKPEAAETVPANVSVEILPTTAHSAMSGCEASTSSICPVDRRWPATLMMSSVRPITQTSPCSSMVPASPVRYQPGKSDR